MAHWLKSVDFNMSDFNMGGNKQFSQKTGRFTKRAVFEQKLIYSKSESVFVLFYGLFLTNCAWCKMLDYCMHRGSVVNVITENTDSERPDHVSSGLRDRVTDIARLAYPRQDSVLLCYCFEKKILDFLFCLSPKS
jgi:hypothetical protein